MRLWLMTVLVVGALFASAANGQTATATATDTPTHTPTETATPTATPPRFCDGSCSSGACGTPFPNSLTGGEAGDFSQKQINATVTGTGAALQYGCKQCSDCSTVWYPATPEAGNKNWLTEMKCAEISCRIGACSSGTCTGEAYFTR